MTSTLSSKPVISNISLAVLEDTGWYQPDYSYSSKLVWGLNQGCQFAKSSCIEWLEYAFREKISPFPFCNFTDDGEQACEPDSSDTVICRIHNYNSDLPPGFQVWYE